MRASTFMGTAKDIKNNCSNFYQNIVSMGQFQLVQQDSNKQIQPGADVKTFLNQRVLKTISIATAASGHANVAAEMGDAACALIEVFDPKKKGPVKFCADAARFSRAMSPLKLSPELQDHYMLNILGSLPSLKVNFPDDEKLKAKYGMSTFTSHVTHVALDESPAGLAKLMKSLKNHAIQINSDYESVRVADPFLTASKEIVTLFRIYGMPADRLFGQMF